MKSLRTRMTQIAFFALLMVFIMISMIINFTISVHNSIQADDTTKLISENGGRMPNFIDYDDEDLDDRKNTKKENDIAFPWGYNEESPFKTRYFLVTLNDKGKAIDTDISHIAAITKKSAYEMAENAYRKEYETGYENEYRYRLVNDEDSTYMIFLDCSENFRTRKVVLLITLAIFLGFTALITIIFGICSKYVLKPFEENSKRQKQFVTDASHELKTPLAIISANAEVLEYKTGESKWTKTITDEVQHMSRLINQLLTLAKLEETAFDTEKEQFDLSEKVVQITEKFTEVVSAKNVVLKKELDENILFCGNFEQIEQLISVLTENAAKYVTENGNINITLSAKGKKVFFNIFNTAELDPETDYERLFDRFYRTDRSRSSKTGGHGIGLSIAKHITEIYGGTIKAYPKDDGLEFAVTLINSK